MGTRSWRQRFVVGALALVWVTFASSPCSEAQSSRPAGEWHATGGDHTNTKYSPLDQITPDNFTDLEIAWRWTSISTDVTEQNRSIIPPNGFKTTPLMAGGLIYLSTSLGQVAALDAGSGALVWSYDPHAYERMGRPASMGWQHRGVFYWEDDESDDARIFIALQDLRLVALNARTGALYPDFGHGGFVDLSISLGREINPVRVTHTSPVAIARDVVVVSEQVEAMPLSAVDGGGRLLLPEDHCLPCL